MSNFSVIPLVGMFFCLSSSAFANCNDSYSVTNSTITINWDYSTCKNIRNSGDKFRLCWHDQGTFGFLCNHGNFKSQNYSGSVTITGLQPGTTYRVRTEYRRAYWDNVSQRYIPTNSNTSAGYINVSPPQNGNCRTLHWGGVSAIQQGQVRELSIKERKIAKFGWWDQLQMTDVSSEIPNFNGVYTFQKCGFWPGRGYKVQITQKDMFSNSYSTITNEITFW